MSLQPARMNLRLRLTAVASLRPIHSALGVPLLTTIASPILSMIGPRSSQHWTGILNADLPLFLPGLV